LRAAAQSTHCHSTDPRSNAVRSCAAHWTACSRAVSVSPIHGAKRARVRELFLFEHLRFDTLLSPVVAELDAIAIVTAQELI
jgi:hypothetical protein